MTIKLKETEYLAGSYDVIVVGGGHAGCEACLAAARMGAKTLLVTMSPDAIALAPCNPSIGGTAKSTLVREIDAMGGAMGLVTDRTQIQIRMLNTGKGPAVQALRAQIDKPSYQRVMRQLLDNQPNLDLRQAEVVSLVISDHRVEGVISKNGAVFASSHVILAGGTSLGGKVIIGDYSYPSGPTGYPPAIELGKFLRDLGLPVERFKTGTPARVDKNTIDFRKTQEQPGDTSGLRFSFMADALELPKRPSLPCWLSYTNEKTHQIIRDNLHRAPLFSGRIEGVGPRYCPSIEDKVVRFPQRDSHQLFLEPEGLDSREYYVQGMSSSLPEEVQRDFMHTIPGLENVVIIRPAYAIEYDCLQPTQLKPTLEHKEIVGLFSAGQLNGSSGYEEAAAQGLLAGINAACAALEKPGFTLDRSQAYIGVMVDDLVTKGVREPYRLFTSLAEYRLVMRQDNADMRLTEIADGLGLIDEARRRVFAEKKQAIEEEYSRLEQYHPSQTELAEKNYPVKGETTLQTLMRRPENTYDSLAADFPPPKELPGDVREQVEIMIKYEGYINKQHVQIERFKRIESKRIPQEIDYAQVGGLSMEAAQKLAQIRPLSIGQAGRITGVSPADINVLLVYLHRFASDKAGKTTQKP